MSINFDQRYIDFNLERDYPAAPPEEVLEELPQEMASMDGIQLASAPSQTMTDAGAGRGEMRAYDPTTRERLASFLQAGFEGMGVDRAKARKQAQTLIGGPSSNLPLTLGLADILPVIGTGLQTEEAVRIGGEAVQSAKAGEFGTAALQAGGAAIGMVPGAVGTVKATKAAVRAAKKGAN